MEKGPKGQTGAAKSWRTIAAASIVLAAVFIKWSCPQLQNRLQTVFIGPENNAAQQAFYALSGQLGSGGSVERAIAVFCQGVLDET